MSSISKICRSPLKQNVANTLEKETAHVDLLKHLRAVAPTLSEIFYKCEWQGHQRNCPELFQEIITEEGVCFTFNFLNAPEVYRVAKYAKPYSYFK